MIGLFRFRHFYSRILITSNIDAAGMILLLIGAALQSPNAAFAVKVGIVRHTVADNQPAFFACYTAQCKGFGL